MTNNNIYVKTFAVVWPYIIITSLLAFIVFHFTTFNATTIVVSYFLGSTVSVMLMSQNYKSLMKQATLDHAKLQSKTMKNYVFRFLFYGLILTIAHFNESLMMIPVFVGFTSFKLALMLTALIFRKDDDDA